MAANLTPDYPNWMDGISWETLRLNVPKDNTKKAQAAEQFFSALHGILRDTPDVQEHISLEIVATAERITFYAHVPSTLRDFIESQLYAQYPELQIQRVPDYTNEVKLEGMHVACSSLELVKEDVYPIMTYSSLEVDPLASITSSLSNLQGDEEIWLQLLIRPVGDSWQDKSLKYVSKMRKEGEAPKIGSLAYDITMKFVRFGLRTAYEVIQPSTGVGKWGDTKPAAEKPAEAPKLAAPVEAALKAIEQRVTKLGFEAKIRTVAVAASPEKASSYLQGMVAAFKQFNATNLNGFTGGPVLMDDVDGWEAYLTRDFRTKGSLMNTEEVASIYHFPSTDVDSSTIAYAGSKKADAPSNIPTPENVPSNLLTVLGDTDYRTKSQRFGIKLDDRMRHMYVIGRSGSGKSTLIENMVWDDVHEGRGVIVVDPHGDLAEKIVHMIPEHRMKDVIYFDPSDTANPIAFNLLETVDVMHRSTAASGFIGVIKRLFDSWGPRLEYILRNTVSALLEYDGATMMSITRMLTDKAFRNMVVDQVSDQVIREFWRVEWDGMTPQMQAEAIAPILNKVGQFLANPTVRNIVGQPKSSFNMREVLDEQKILLVNLSKGKIGEDTMRLIGGMVITKVQLAAMSRANVSAAVRPPCFLYVDEFQNFANDSFAVILSEARKYNVGLVVAHQYMDQLEDTVRSAVIGNVGTTVSFRVGTGDTDQLAKEFEPVFGPNDLLNLERGHVYMKLLIDGLAVPAFSAKMMPPRIELEPYGEQVLVESRARYTRPREEVEGMIDELGGFKQRRETETAKNAAADALKQASGTMAIKPNISLPAVKPVVLPPEIMQAPVTITPVVDQPPQPAPIPEEVTEQKANKPKERTEKPPRTMDGWVYREVAQKGGQRWFLGEQESVFRARKEALERARLERQQAAEQDAATQQSAQPVATADDQPVFTGEGRYL
jgi:hypothetical protein